MPVLPQRQKGRTPYWLKFSLMIGAFGTTTAAFVLVVLPQRFVLQAGLVESGVSFLAGDAPFSFTDCGALIQPPVTSMTQPVTLGHAEVFWSNVLPVLRREAYEEAVPMFRHYLERHPDEADVWRELAVVLTRLGRTTEAEEIYLRLADDLADPVDLLTLARMLRDAGDFERSLDIYHRLVASEPGDLQLLYEYAQALVWAERYREAADAYRSLLAAAPDRHSYRLELARLLYWYGFAANALILLSEVPGDAPEYPAAAGFRGYLDSLHTASLPLGRTVIERARLAVAEQDHGRAASLFKIALSRYPHDTDLWLEWTDFLQYHTADLPAAQEALVHLGTLRDLDPDEQYRLAQLHAWNGEERKAADRLVTLLAHDPGHADAWALLGDMYLWQGLRGDAAAAYERCLALAPSNERAALGMTEVKRQTQVILSQRESPRAGPELLFLTDSDEFERFDLSASANFLWSSTTMLVRAGYKSVRGFRLDGSLGSERGPFAEVEIGKWWRLGTVRTSLTTGADRLDLSGTEPILGLRIEAPDLDGTAVLISYDHGRALDETYTLESVEAGVISDYLQSSAFRPLGHNWTLSGSAGVATLRTAGSTNLRLNAALSAGREFTSALDGSIVSQFLSFGDSASSGGGRRLYWDPSVFWSNGVRIAVHTQPGSDWSAYVRLTPGLALVNERSTPGLDLVPQFGSEAGIGLETDRIRFHTDGRYTRGREGGYSSFGLTAVFSVKY